MASNQSPSESDNRAYYLLNDYSVGHYGYIRYFYQFTCFPIYGIKTVRRGDYIIFDRHQLHYLNFIEKFHCTYCAYGSGMIAYVSEIIARTEQYFCPIKHARKVLGTHSRYARFLDFGEAENYEQKLNEYRNALERK